MIKKTVIAVVALIIASFLSLPTWADSGASQGYYRFNRAIYNARNLEDVYPCLPKAVVVYMKERAKLWQDNKVKWYKNTHYVYTPKITSENAIQGADGNECDLYGKAYIIFNQKYALVDIYARMKEEDHDWKLVSFRYQGNQ